MANLISKVGSKLLQADAQAFKAVSKDFSGLRGLNKKLHKCNNVVSGHNASNILNKSEAMLRSGIRFNNVEIPADTFLAQVPQKQRKAIANLLGNPDKVVLSAKANTKGSGFSILGFIGKKGDKAVGKGAVSVSHLGTPDAVAKWRFNGKNLQTNGFVDCAQTATPEQVSIIPSFVKKMFGIDAQAGKAVGMNLNVNAKKAVDILPDGQLGNLAGKQYSGVSQNALDRFMDRVRNILT